MQNEKPDARSGSSKGHRHQMILQHLPLVRHIAYRICETLPASVQLDDLVQAGMVGLIDAATKFQPDKQVAFTAYAKHRIRGAILDSLRQLDWTSREARGMRRKSEAATQDFL